MELSPRGSSQFVVFAEISKVEISEKVLERDKKERVFVYPLLVDFLLRLGNGQYGKITIVNRVN